MPYTGCLNNRSSFTHSSGGWDVQDQGADWFDSCWEFSSCLIDGHILAVSSEGTHTHGGSGRESTAEFFLLCTYNPPPCS